MGRIGKILIGGLIAVSGPAWAGESLISGEQLRYNYAYKCNGERIIVAHCRDNDDSSYCQVVYPDRPEQNGNQVAPVEMRGDIAARLDACTRPKATSVASNAPEQPSQIKARAPTQSLGAPGLGKATWSVLDLESDYLTLFNKARLARTKTIGSGWFTTVYPRPKDYPDFNVSNVEFEQYRYEADCMKGMIRLTAMAFFDDDGKLIQSGAGPGKWGPMEPGTFGDRKFKILCGKPQPLALKSPVVGDGTYLAMYIASMLEHKGGQ
jgi:hypothetical protein